MRNPLFFFVLISPFGFYSCPYLGKLCLPELDDHRYPILDSILLSPILLFEVLPCFLYKNQHLRFSGNNYMVLFPDNRTKT